MIIKRQLYMRSELLTKKIQAVLEFAFVNPGVTATWVAIGPEGKPVLPAIMVSPVEPDTYVPKEEVIADCNFLYVICDFATTVLAEKNGLATSFFVPKADMESDDFLEKVKPLLASALKEVVEVFVNNTLSS